ncbi:neuronal calcium sensor 1 [Nematocida sp. LUAm3]|nr:neuronal calcium sensor 1 [Nematocida sp. LUAm3]KAI5174576.1 neuronal calcium sensor 1 [Nematocida sp. LUAm2]KAI5178018.1 neuronal calcium sensor 1 [Nematocida sp. LUAm1]
MQRTIKDPINNEKKEELQGILGKLFPLGDPKEVSSSLVSSLEENSEDSLIKTASCCRKTRHAYAKWIFSYIDKEKQGFITANNLKSLFLSFSQLTGITNPQEIKVEKISENEFISMCLSSEAFNRSWAALRKHTKLNL